MLQDWPVALIDLQKAGSISTVDQFIRLLQSQVLFIPHIHVENFKLNTHENTSTEITLSLVRKLGPSGC